MKSFLKEVIESLIFGVMVLCLMGGVYMICNNADNKKSAQYSGMDASKRFCIDEHEYAFVSVGYGAIVPVYDMTNHAKKCEGDNK